MEQEQKVDMDKCMNGRCWSGPMLLVETEKGAIGDLCVAVKVFLGKVHGKEAAQRMVRTLTLGQVHEEDTIIGFAMGREPHGSILREICALIEVHRDGILVTHSATYRFSIKEEHDEGAYSTIIAHYRWLKGFA